MKIRRKAAATTTLAAAVATAFAGLLGVASPAEAACASFWGVGNTPECQSTVGSFAVVLTETGTAKAAGIGGAIALGEGSLAETDGTLVAALASGKDTYAGAFGTGSLAQDVGNDENEGSSAISAGWFNRALNYGNNNHTVVESAAEPKLDLGSTPPVIDLGNNTVLNLGNNNWGTVQGGFSTGVYQFGSGNVGAGGGVESNLIQLGDENHGTGQIPSAAAGSTYPSAIGYPARPNTAVGLFTTNNVFGNRNTANAQGNINGALTVGEDNENNVIGGHTENPDLPLPFAHPNLSTSNVFGNENRINVLGNADLTNVLGDDNVVGVVGHRNITTLIGNGNKVSVLGERNLTTNLGQRSKLQSLGDNNVNASLGDDKTSIKRGDETP